MREEEVKVAGLAVKSVAWDKEINYASIENLVRQAAKEGANIVCTPETSLQGYLVLENPEREAFLENGEPVEGIYTKRFGGLAKELCLYLAIGFSERAEAAVYNSVSIWGPHGEMVGLYRKVHMGEEESLFYAAGDEFPVFETDFGLIGIMTCFDRQYPETVRALSLRGARLILNPSAGGYGEWNDALVRTRAYENKAYVLFAHPRDSFVADPFGDIVARKGQNESLVVRKIDLAFAEQLRSPRCAAFKDVPELWGRWHNQFQTRRPELYGVLSRMPER